MKKRNTIAVCTSLVYVAVMSIIWLNILGEVFNESLSYLNQNIGIIISQAVVLGGAYLIYAFIGEPEINDVIGNEKKINGKGYVICVISSVILLMLMLAFKELVGNVWYLLKREALFEYTLEESTATVDITQAVISVISVGIITPIFEEMYFRKTIIGGISNVHPVCLVVASVFCFLLMHRNLEQIVYIMPMAIYVSIIYIKTYNIKYCVLTHMIINCVGIFWEPKEFPLFSWKEVLLKDDKTFSLICIVGLIMCIVVLMLGLRYVNEVLKIRKEEKYESNIRQSVVYIIVCVLFCIVMLTRLYGAYMENNYISYDDTN